jgi:hypothetical protein
MLMPTQIGTRSMLSVRLGCTHASHALISMKLDSVVTKRFSIMRKPVTPRGNKGHRGPRKNWAAGKSLPASAVADMLTASVLTRVTSRARGKLSNC